MIETWGYLFCALWESRQTNTLDMSQGDVAPTMGSILIGFRWLSSAGGFMEVRMLGLILLFFTFSSVFVLSNFALSQNELKPVMVRECCT